MGPIFVVDDDQDIRSAICEILQDEGYRVSCFANGREALDVLETEVELPSLVFLDLMMPVMDGRAFSEAVRSSKRLASVPIVLITAAGIERTQGLKVDRVLTKPIGFKTIKQVAAEMCSGA